MKRSIVFIFLIIFLSNLALAIDQYPTGNIIMRNTYSILNLSTAQGNISNFTKYYGDGSQLTGVAVPWNYSTYFDQSLNTTSNITAAYFIGNGSLLTDVASPWIYSDYFNQQLNSTGNISAQYFLGDGSLLSGISTYNYTPDIELKLNITDQRYNDTGAISLVDGRVTAVNGSLSNYAILVGNNNFIGNNSFIGNIIIYNATQTNYNTSIELKGGSGVTNVNISATGSSFFNGGNVGIGLGRSTPSAVLDVNGSTAPVFRVTQSNDAYKMAIFKGSGSNNQGIIIGNSTDGATNGRGFHIGFWQTLGFGYLAAYDWANTSYQPINFQGRNISFETGVSTTTTKMFINGSGSVGVGTLNPATILDVNGTITGTSFTGITKPMVASWDAGCNDGNFLVAIDSNFSYCATPTIATSGFNVTGDLRTVGNEYMTGNEFITGNLNVSGSINATSYNGITKQMVKNWDTACTAGDFISAIDDNYTYCNTPTNAQNFNVSGDLRTVGNEYMTGNKFITGNLTMNGEVILNNTVWEDLRFPASAINPAGAANPMTYDSTNLGFTAANGAGDTYIAVIGQMPHSYKFGSDLHPHLHWQPSNTDIGVVNFTLEYKWTNINEVESGTWTTLSMLTPSSGVTNNHTVSEWDVMNGTGKTLSSTLSIKISRREASATDNFTGNVLVKEFDLHYEMDTLGSASETGKWS